MACIVIGFYTENREISNISFPVSKLPATKEDVGPNNKYNIIKMPYGSHSSMPVDRWFQSDEFIVVPNSAMGQQEPYYIASRTYPR